MPKRLRSLVAFFLILAFTLAPISPHGIHFQFSRAEDDNAWQDYENYTVIDRSEIWSGNVVYSDFSKPVVLVNGATLTIEKGTHIQLTNMTVHEGRIVAQGTPAEPIIFTKTPTDTSQYPPEYDPNCYVRQGGMIEFYDWVEDENEQPSVFNNVEFEGMGTYVQYDTDNCMPMVINTSPWPSIINTAYAQDQTKYNPAISFNSGRLKIENSTFKNNFYSDIEARIENYEGEPSNYLEISNSNFEGNAQNYALISNVVKYDVNGESMDDAYVGGFVRMNNNWYGSADGPQTSTNNKFGGEILMGVYELNSWSPTRFESNVTSGASNVLFLPGIEASRLYTDGLVGDNTLWEPNRNADVEKLYLDKDGKSLNSNVFTKEGDILDETPVGANIYKSFIGQMDKLKNEEKVINDWKPIAYDWRLSLDDILADGSIINILRDLAKTSKSGKVTIVAHSNGGLLTKALMKKLGDEEAKNLVDKIIFVAVPQVGTPAATAAMLHGYEQNFFPVLNTKTARGLAENMPGAYNLLPSEKYFSTVETPVITFDTNSSTDWKQRFSNDIDSKNELHDFLVSDYRRVSATNSDVDIPDKLNESLLNKAENLHEDLDAWFAPEGVKVIQIAGWGVPNTLSSTKYDVAKKNFCEGGLCQSGAEVLDPNFKFTIDGDGTVETPSALWMKEADRYWVDMGKWNKDYPFSTTLGFNSREHKNILEIAELLDFIKTSIKQENSNLPDYLYSNVPSIDGRPTRLQYSLHSPLTLELYDNQGRHTGIDAEGNIEENIPGTYYKQFGDKKYIFTDEDVSGQIVMNGYAEGTFTFAVEEFEGDTPTGVITFKDMPTTPQTKATIDVENNLASVSNLNIDKEGDGKTDYSLKPKIGEVITLDVTPPEAKIIFNPLTQKLDVIGTDDISKNVVTTIEEKEIFEQNNQRDKKKISWFQKWLANRKDKKIISTATMTDEAGNKTEISWGRKMSKDRRIDISLLSISYNGEKTTLLDSGLQYKWIWDQRKKSYQLFASHLDSSVASVESHYVPSKNQTWLMEKPKELADDDSDDNAEKRPVRKKLPGMVIPAIITEKGDIKINY